MEKPPPHEQGCPPPRRRQKAYDLPNEKKIPEPRCHAPGLGPWQSTRREAAAGKTRRQPVTSDPAGIFEPRKTGEGGGGVLWLAVNLDKGDRGTFAGQGWAEIRSHPGAGEEFGGASGGHRGGIPPLPRGFLQREGDAAVAPSRPLIPRFEPLKICGVSFSNSPGVNGSQEMRAWLRDIIPRTPKRAVVRRTGRNHNVEGIFVPAE